MPISLRRRRVDSEMEDKILTAMIVSERFCREISSQVKPSHFNVPYGKKILKWIQSYYNTYGTNPGPHIQDIFNAERNNLRDGESSVIEEYLSSLNDRYEENSLGTNVDYLMDQSVRFFNKQNLVNLKDNIESLLVADCVEDADQLVISYKDIVRQRSGGWYNPFQEEVVTNTIIDMEDGADVLYQLPGDIGELFGPLEIQWLVGLMGPMKRGKTNWMLEFLIRGMFNRINSVFISLEMKERTINKRLYRRIGPYVEGGGSLIYPSMDCLRNQDGTCNLPIRPNRIRLIEYAGERINYPTFSPSSPYRVCSICHEQENNRFIPATWFETIQCGSLSLGNISKRSRAISNMFGNRVRVKSYPAFSANIKTIIRDLDELDYAEGFVPRQIIIDYADILAPENASVTGRDRVDETWKAMKNLADVRRCLVVTATQSNRASIKKRTVRQEDTGEDIRKIANVDIMGTLNQLATEKRRGVMRVGLCAHRHKDFNENDQCLVLQQIAAGQVLLDSVKLRKKQRDDDECSDDECSDE